MKYWVYILKSERDNTFYIGLSRDPHQRLIEHNSGYSKYTKGHIPYTLVYEEEHIDRMSARKREKYFKSGVGRQFFKNYLYSPVAQSVEQLAVNKQTQLPRETEVETAG